jgi:3'-5' exoribonuclease
MMVEKHASEIPDFPDEKKFLVMHMILSHHGKREYGSPVLPAIPEALALHHIDNLDAKTVAARRLIDADSENDRAWTDRSWMLDTQLYKSSLPCGEGHVAPSVENRPAPETAKPKPETGSLFG